MTTPGPSRVPPVRGACVAALLAAAPAAHAQSTDRLDPVTRPLRLEVSLGIEAVPLPFPGAAPGGTGGTVLAGVVAPRWQGDGPAGIRASAWWIQRRMESRDAASRDRLIAFTLSGDVALRVWRRVTVAPSLGLGMVPSARAVRTVSRSSAGAPGTTAARLSQTGSGTMWTAGLAVRAGRLVVEQHLLGLLGAEEAIREHREYYPITIGWRF